MSRETDQSGVSLFPNEIVCAAVPCGGENRSFFDAMNAYSVFCRRSARYWALLLLSGVERKKRGAIS